jgi:calcium/calmodulin-dependent protein kinase I
VREGVHKHSKEKFAIKCIKRSELTEEDDEAIMTEVAILQQMHHPNIMTLREFFVEPEYYYLVTEFVSGGELFDRIVEKTFYTEKEARDLVKILLSAIKYCHEKDVVHRDLKPENLLLMSADDDASIKLADFGFAKTVTKDDEGLVTTCGTPGYVAPEILEGTAYGKPVDIWSIGVITYILLAGYPPFHDDSQPILFRKIRKGKYQYDSPYWDNVSDDAKDFISRMLIVDPKKRATAQDLLEHRWIVDKDVATVPLTSALTELRRFHARKKFKAAVHSVQAINSMNKALSSSSSSLGSDGASHNKLRVGDSEVSL